MTRRDREYQEWLKRSSQRHSYTNRRNTGKNNYLRLIILFLVVAVAVISTANLSSFFGEYGNSLEFLTKEFVTEIDEPVVYTPTADINNDNYQAIDAVGKTIKYSGDSTDELAQLLADNASTEIEKARIIYTWITHNIDYNVAALDELFKNNVYPDVTTKAVLSYRATICSGYANLYQQLAEKMGLKSVIVIGYAQAGDYIVGVDDRVNHAWNAVKIDGDWYLLDATWGSGTVNNDRFEAKFNPFYFAPKPEEFIYTHYPLENQWQLLSNTYSRSQFDQLPDVAPELFKNGIELVSHKGSQISADDRLAVVLKAQRDIVAIANLERDKQPVEGNYTLVQRQGENIMVNVTFPQAGDYQLNIFAKPQDGNNSYPLVVSYDVSVTGSSPQMPKIFKNFIENNGYIESPLEGSLVTQNSAYFKIKVDNAIDVQVVDQVTKKWHKLDRYGNVFAGNVPVKYSPVVVLAKFERGNRYWALVEYK